MGLTQNKFANVSITSSDASYKELNPKVPIKRGQKSSVGYISKGELKTYDSLVIAPTEEGVSYSERKNETNTLCFLPLPAA
jgi:hypothetical protein